MSCYTKKHKPILTEGKEQTGAPCPIGVICKTIPLYNYISTPQPTSSEPHKKNRPPRPRSPQNIIKIRMEGMAKDIVIKFGDRENLINALKTTVEIISNNTKS